MKGPSFSLLGLTLVNVAASVVVLCGLSTTRAQAAPTPEQSIRTQRLELLDASGQVRGQFFVEPSGEAVLRMRDESGQIRVKLGASGRGAGFLLLDDATEPPSICLPASPR
jgi:hypothetical protein